ncbi:Rad52/Rad22 family DNA repair protein [Singulisphaera sp. PoT]|uniref:Rad52/Rad22 family DNA repair protein n=1 Tax=Singulisphaera sp. PoT TaxID=3411797 RepID=UPI003BF4815A
MATNFPEIFTALMAPFEGNEVKVRTQANRQLHYITARTAMNRLDEVLGPENWWDAYRPGENSVMCELTIRLPDKSTLTKCDAGGYAGMADSGDDDKSGFSDAFKRACAKFGIARYLYRDGIPDFVRESYEAPAPSSPSNNGHQHEGQPHQTEPDPRAPIGALGGKPFPKQPRSGRALFATIRELEQRYSTEIVKPCNDWGRAANLSGKLVDWSEQEVAKAWAWLVNFAANHGWISSAHQAIAPPPGESPLKAMQRKLWKLIKDKCLVEISDPEHVTEYLLWSELNGMLNEVSPGEVVGRLGELTDEGVLRRLVAMAEERHSKAERIPF